MGRFGRTDDASRVVFDFGPPSAAPAPVDYAPPRPMPAPPAPPRPEAKFRREVTAVVAVFAVLLVAGVVVRLRPTSSTPPPVVPEASAPKVSLPPLLEDINAPATIGGAPRLATRYSKALASAYRQKLPNHGRFAEIEVYGHQDPEYLVVAGGFTKGDAKAMFRMVAAKETGITFGPLRTYAGGIACATMTFSGIRGSLCAWAGKVSDGALGGYEQPSPAALARLTARVRTDVERGE